MTAAGYQWSRPPDPRRPGLRTVVDLLHLHRLAAGWSRAKVARVALLSVETVSAMERHATRAPRLSTLASVAAALDAATVDELVRLERCPACAHAALGSFLLARWSVSRSDDGRGVHLAAPDPVVEIARRHADALWPLIDLLLAADDKKETP